MAVSSPASELAAKGPRFRLRTLGGLSVEGVDAAVPSGVNQRKRLAFLALLAASGPRGIARERLLLLLWPESTTERARGALYQLLYVMRQAFGEECVVGSDEIQLDPNIVSSDVGQFSDAIARGDWAAAVDLYAGSFLDAVHLSGAPELERWIEQKRQELARAYQSALAQLVTQAMSRRDHSAAIALAERLVAADPLSERATVLLMEALAASGDVTSALERAREHTSFVRQELDVSVDTSVSALAARLRSDSRPVAAVATPPSHRIQHLATNAPSSVRPQPSRQTRLIAGAMAAATIIGMGALIAMRPTPVRDREFVVVADFETGAADNQVADVLTVATQRALSASQSLSPVPDTRLLAARERLHQPRGARLTLDLARQLAMGDDIRTVVDGSLKSFGGKYLLVLRLRSAVTNEVLAQVEKSGVALEHVFDALDGLTRELREAAGDDLAAVRAQPSVLTLTSGSLDAMTDYVTALRLPRDSAARAVALLRDAVTRDTSFASALWRLAFFMEAEGHSADGERRKLLERAWRHREGLTEYEQMRVEIAYKLSPNGITPDPNEHLERLRKVVERYPNIADAKILAAMYAGRRDLVGAERTYRLMITLDPSRPDGYVGLTNTYLWANRIPDARRTIDELVRKTPRSQGADILDAQVSYAEGRRDKTRAILRRMMDSTGQSRVFGYIHAAFLDLLEGRVAAWERRMREKDSLPESRPPARGLRAPRLWAKYWVEDRPADGLRMLEITLSADSSLRFELEAAEFYAALGRPDSARALLAARGKRDFTAYMRGADTLPASAWIDLAEGRPRDAAAKFREALHLSGGDASSQIRRDAETGRAFELAGLPDSAIAVYEHYLNAPPSWEMDAQRLVWILEHVAGLYEQRGDRRKARDAYTRVVDLWKDADSELQPRVTRAREHAAALSRETPPAPPAK